jgi:prepilin-type N-terminal cleavage/methylation domain-containing protein
MLRTKTESGGFTLLEVLVAMTIMGIVLTTVLELLAGSLHSASASKEFARAAVLGERKFEQILNSEDMFKNEEWPSGGELEEGYEWDLGVVPYAKYEEEEESFPLKVYRCVFKVRWESGRRSKSIEFKAFKSVPKSGTSTVVTE